MTQSARKEELITGTHQKIMAELSRTLGYTLFTGEEALLANPDIEGVMKGTHTVARYPTAPLGHTKPVIQAVTQEGYGYI